MIGDYGQLAESDRLKRLFQQELRPVVRLAALLFLSPITLWIGTLILDVMTDDLRVEGHGDRLLLSGLAAASLGGWQLTSRILRALWLRQALLGLATVATVGIAIGNVYLGMKSNAKAVASSPERVYQWHSSRGRAPFRTTTYFFQRADGTYVDGSKAEAPIDYGRRCSLVRRLDEPYGYAWVRVLERSRSPGSGELSWPIRREECFSDIPLSTLPR